MRIIYTKSYDRTYKDLKKYKKELEILRNIIDLLERIPNFSSLISDPISRMYNFERLKHDFNEFYSFRLSKVFRLIVRPCGNDVQVELVYISTNHYKDFDRGKVIYYDE